MDTRRRFVNTLKISNTKTNYFSICKVIAVCSLNIESRSIVLQNIGYFVSIKESGLKENIQPTTHVESFVNVNVVKNYIKLLLK